MRTNLEFRSTDFPPIDGEEEQINNGRYGKRLADLLCANLPRYGFQVTSLTPEDWGWRTDLRNEEFPLWFGCGNYDEYDDGFLCIIAPSKSSIRRWLRRIPTTATVERLASALESILRDSGKVSQLRWWTEDENARG